MKDHRSDQYILNLSSWEKKTETILGLNGDWTHDLCNTSAVLNQLGYQANWELITLWDGHGFDPRSSFKFFQVSFCYAMFEERQNWNFSVSCLYIFFVLTGLDFFQVLFATTSSVVFLAVRIY